MTTFNHIAGLTGTLPTRYICPNISGFVMSVSRRLLLAAPVALAAAGRAFAGEAITVAYAGSMGRLMDKGMNPSFTAATGTPVHGIGQAAVALAHLITGGAMKPDVF